ncbi:MAG: hypothetical protein K0R58_2901 [Ramlibacter sp.]|jgi:hypothetical protein|nr:hypothetical protein [Ramlibacter sp.]
MSHSESLELERLAVKYSPEIHRAIPWMTDDEARGHLTYLRRIDAEARGRDD